MNIRQAPPGAVQEPTGPLQLVCSSDDLLREVENLQQRVREPVLAAQLRGPDGRRKEAILKLAKEAPVLYRECRPLFEKALRPLSDADRDILGFMIAQMRNVERARENASVEKVSENVGQFLFDRFVAPKIDEKPTTSTVSIEELKDSPPDTPEE